MKNLFLALTLLMACGFASAQEYFTIRLYKVNLTVNKDASLDIEETIDVHFTEQRHGIIRAIPYKYQLTPLPPGTEKADRQLESNGYTHTIIENIKVPGWNFEVNNDGDYKAIRIGSADKYVDGDQQYIIKYRMLNAINFFKDHSELYFNIIGDKWATTIDSVIFTVSLYDAVPDTPAYFFATGRFGAVEKNAATRWIDLKTFTGHTTKPLDAYEGLTVGITLPKDFLDKPNFAFRGAYWVLLPIGVFILMYLVWRRWGKDDPVTITTQYYPPKNVSPAICGYVIDQMLNRRDLTALIPYWGAGGYLRINEKEESSLFGLIKSKEYEFVKLKDLPDDALNFERTLFYGIFKSYDTVELSSLKDKLYTSMAEAKKELEKEITLNEYYVYGTRGVGVAFIVAGIIIAISGVNTFLNDSTQNLWKVVSIFVSAAIVVFFGTIMSKKTKKGTQLYQELAGFKEFIKTVEKDRLKEFLKQDEHYFDKILPFAIVFNVADTWKDKLEGLDIPPPTWYHGNYSNFSTANFMHSLNNSMNSMSDTFYSSPKGSGSSGGSFGGGGSSGGGFGGGGGSSW